ncbi:MAG: putative bifunctional diguanylate cyclase/phosphodiesterase [Piscinibacter sp.]|uniref:putative bifunctional diguanylate cyclase/phosphodiesterase n=1 Tax=Piscinibacter sp. TaxID=1903157 RepID=UPI003D10AFA9
MGPLDQVLRAGIGLGLIWFGFFDDWFITAPVAGAILGVFGIVNLLFAPLAFCPVYRIASLNTRQAPTEAGGASSAELRNRMLLATIGVSILVLALFGVMAYRIAEDASVQMAVPARAQVAERLASGEAPFTEATAGAAVSVAPPILESLALKLAALGVVVVWLAVWAALVIASTIGRRLDEKNTALVHQARHDELTGLPNRSLLHARLAHGLRLAARERQPLALLIMDLDRFKEVNDTLGHASGDELLRQVAERLQRALRAADTCARLGGDEFSIVLPQTAGDGAVHCAHKIQQVLSEAFVINGVSLRLGTSVGIAVYPEHGQNADTLIQRADVAMYDAKRRQAGHALYAAAADPNSLERLTLANDLRTAIEQGQFELHYQPKLSLQSGRLEGVEALVRWQHPRLGRVAPDRFIPLAEQSGLIRELTGWVLRQAIGTAARWRARGWELSVAVNLSPLDLLDAELPARIGAWLRAADLPASCLELELTESATMADIGRAAAAFEKLAAMGMRIAIDDFGTGMSSLSYLRRLPVDDIKIDRSFVTDMLRDEHNAVLVRSIVDLSHNLGRRVIAEGIEDGPTLERLKALGCDVAQGYFIGRPEPMARIEALLGGAGREAGVSLQTSKASGLASPRAVL